ncbi:hypothetical protein PSACC_02202 [Paramicrosporidium saccamoebae]|uniref:Uncharacterized protein n=1 Tax=Paramicrosporidium saccamoebae TaxID=1246581 RepID=A0A2H9TJI7_9FUNG|nr:hypothetical protein PSACC_02202 [Paramicrosporidium saccamoebae]
MLGHFTIETLETYFESVGPHREDYLTLVRILQYREFDFQSLWNALPPNPLIVKRDWELIAEQCVHLMPIARVQKVDNMIHLLELFELPILFATRAWDPTIVSPFVWSPILGHIARTQLHLVESKEWCSLLATSLNGDVLSLDLDNWKLFDSECVSMFVKRGGRLSLPTTSGHECPEIMLRAAHLLRTTMGDFTMGLVTGLTLLLYGNSLLVRHLRDWASIHSDEAHRKTAFEYLIVYFSKFTFKNDYEAAMFRFELGLEAISRKVMAARQYMEQLLTVYSPHQISPYQASQVLGLLGQSSMDTKGAWHSDWHGLPSNHPAWPRHFVPIKEQHLAWRLQHVTLPPASQLIRTINPDGLRRLLVPKKLYTHGSIYIDDALFNLVQLMRDEELRIRTTTVQDVSAVYNIVAAEGTLRFACLAATLEEITLYLKIRLALHALLAHPLPSLTLELFKTRINPRSLCLNPPVPEVFSALVQGLRRIICKWRLSKSLILR